ncbi:MAG TPA: helix-turn-helix transcriptional regulator [Tissierellaceae bacterium]
MKIDKGLIGGSTTLLILSLLKERDMYGYEIIRELEIRSDNTFKFKEGTLYPVLHRLENEGYIKSYRDKGDTGKERKYYQITSKGKKQLIEERKQWNIFSTSVNKVIGGESHGFSTL